MKPKAVVLVSGGIDSAVLLEWARSRFRPIALTFEIDGRPRGEAKACRALIRRARCPHIVVPVRFLRSQPSGYVPARNLVYHGIAQSIAEAHSARAVVAGHNRSDAKVFPDATPAYFRRLERLGAARIVLPFSQLTDAQVVALGRRLKVPLDLTWSCYRDGARPCGRCAACRGRIESLES